MQATLAIFPKPGKGPSINKGTLIVLYSILMHKRYKYDIPSSAVMSKKKVPGINGRKKYKISVLSNVQLNLSESGTR